jgi:uncharacterized SAM-dependent methyltransferase
MRHFKNSELRHLYNVSDKTVRNWIAATKAGKLNLELFEQDSKLFVADTLPNTFLLEELVQRGKRFRNKRSHRSLTPKPEFYKIYTSSQVIDIINQLDKYHEYPLHYRYFDQGGRYWDAYLRKLYDTPRENFLTTTIELLELDRAYLNDLIKGHHSMNLIDLGVGNGLAAKSLISYLLSRGKLGKYIGIDTSPYLLDVTKQNLRRWFKKDLDIELCLKDLNFERFTEFAVQHHSEDLFNLVLFLGGTIGNFREPIQALHTIRDSMGKGDVLVCSDKLDTAGARRFFDFNIKTDLTELSLHNRFVLELLSIDSSLYEVEQFYDENNNCRIIQVRLKVAISIRFETGSFRKTVNIDKGETIMLFRKWHFTAQETMDLFSEAGFEVLRFSRSSNEEYILVTARVR